MPTSIYMSSGDEFIVAGDDYPSLVKLMQDGAPRTVELHAIWYTDPLHEQFDEDGQWPAYREQRITLLTSQIVAVEEIVGAQASAIARAMQHTIDQM